MSLKEKTTIAVHSGEFQADDVLCVAMEKFINPDVKVERISEVPDTFGDDVIVADIGGGKYDHHQAGARVRKDTGEKYAACGLLFEDAWWLIFPSKDSRDRFERDYIIPIEMTDNGVSSSPDTLSLAISSFVPEWDSDESMDDAFMRAVEMMLGVLRREAGQAESRVRAADEVLAASEDSDGFTVVLPRFVPWDVLCSTKYTARFVIYPSNRGGYNLQAITVEPDSFVSKQALPATWLDEKPEGCTFVHQALFIAGFDTQEHAVAAAKSLEKDVVKEKTFVYEGEMAKSRLYGSERWSFSIVFDDGMEMEVGVQGMDEDPAMPYAQLYDQKGHSVGYTDRQLEWEEEYNDVDPYDLIGPSIHRDWVLEHNGIMYRVRVPEDGEGDVFEEHEYGVFLPPSSKRW